MLLLPLPHVPTFAAAGVQSPGTCVWSHSSAFPTVVLTTKPCQHQVGIPIIFSALCTDQEHPAWSFIPFVVEGCGHRCNADTSQLTCLTLPFPHQPHFTTAIENSAVLKAHTRTKDIAPEPGMSQETSASFHTGTKLVLPLFLLRALMSHKPTPTWVWHESRW